MQLLEACKNNCLIVCKLWYFSVDFMHLNLYPEVIFIPKMLLSVSLTDASLTCSSWLRLILCLPGLSKDSEYFPYIKLRKPLRLFCLQFLLSRLECIAGALGGIDKKF